MTQISGKVVALTGAGSGIGRALAQELVARGAQVALADVNEHSLRETAGLLGPRAKVSVHTLDVRSREAVEKYAADTAAQHGGCDVVINNAGVASHGSIEASSYEDLAFVIDVNMWGVLYGTKAFMPLFRQRGAGHIVNIASINSMVPFANNGPYNMSKYAVYGLNETLMQELRGSSIHVTSVHPGGIQTNIVRNSRNMTEGDVKRFAQVARTSPKSAARVILDGIEKNQERVFVGVDAKLMALAKRTIPAITVGVAGYLTNKVWGQKGKRA